MQKVIKPDLTLREFELFKSLIREQSGIELGENQIDSLRISLLARTSEKHFREYVDYYDFLKDHPDGKEEFKELLNLITVNETCFFRQPNHFGMLRKYVIPEIVRSKKERKLNIWSAGCSTGEEPYSIAITIKEHFPRLSQWQVRILATDVSKKALAAAEEAVYGMRTLRLVEPEILDKYFKPIDGKRCHLKEEIKDMVCFGYHNLIKEPYPVLVMSDWDIIFCRNVTIYFNIESTKRVIDNFYMSLSDKGYLFVGYAEMIQHLSRKFKPVEMDDMFIYKKSKEEEENQTDKKIIITPSFGNRLKALLLHNSPELEESDNEILSKAEAFFEEEKYQLALVETEKLLARSSRNLAAHLLNAQVYANEKRYSKAKEEAQAAIRIDKMNGPAHYLLGVIYEKQDRIERAIDEYRKTLYIDKTFALAYFNIANIYRQQGRTEEAVRELKNATAAVRQAPQGEWTKFTGGFHNEAIVEAAEKITAKLIESKV